MNATPLHLAVWNDYNEIALRLIQANADPYLKMNDISNAFDLARENSNDVLLELLNDFMKFKRWFVFNIFFFLFNLFLIC